jgi:opacity protein-like surface antigen
MRKIIFALACLTTIPAIAQDVWDDDYESYAKDMRHDNYVGVRLHKNENILYAYDIHGQGGDKVRKDNLGFGAVVGNRLTDHIKIEFETMYTGAKQTKRDTEFDFDVWANMLNIYAFQEYQDAVAPYVGLGIGLTGIWADINSTSYPKLTDSVLDLSFSAMIGVNLALNSRVDLNMGFKYQYYGEVEHIKDNREVAVTDVDATEFYIGASYKFDM